MGERTDEGTDTVLGDLGGCPRGVLQVNDAIDHRGLAGARADRLPAP